LPISADWTNQIALVTGASRGIGAAIARRLAAHGAAVCLNCASSTSDADAVAADIRTTGGRAIVVQADVADAESVDRMVTRAETELGPLTILVNNAGISSGGAGSLETYDAARMARMRAVNADGVIHTVRAVAPGMKARGYGRIVNIASNAAIGTSLAGTTFYAASKAEVLILTRRFAMELGRSGITVNCVAPGWVVTEMTRAGHSEAEFADRVKAMSERSMLGRVGAAEDIAVAVAFLASPEARYLTAQVLTVDGGRMDYIGHG
jgi:3-oxoacyl-[acyl-carrier protein] reductase